MMLRPTQEEPPSPHPLIWFHGYTRVGRSYVAQRRPRGDIHPDSLESPPFCEVKDKNSTSLSLSVGQRLRRVNRHATSMKTLISSVRPLEHRGPSGDSKNSLKVKLMMRRPIKMLVDQGIMPPLKTPPAFHEQRQKLERAKMGDLLKAKIQQRPNRQDLVNQHILEDAHVDPSIAEKQRMLKKARLADSLNDQLSHRPGPLELIQKNILHTEEPIERAVKDGVIPFKPTYEGQLTKPQHPNRYITYDEDSLSSEGGQSPLQTQPSTGLPEVRTQADVLEAAAASAGIVTVALTIPTTGGAVVVTSSSPAFRQAVSPVSDQQTATMTFADLCNSVVSPAGSLPTILPTPSPMSLGSTTSSLSPLSSVSSPPTPSPALARRTDAPGKDKNRKKSKSKSQPKTRTIKFHEYKGPPNAHKNLSINSLPVETPYEILLQQQKLFLQWQLEWQHKNHQPFSQNSRKQSEMLHLDSVWLQYPQIILPASQKPLQVTTSSDVGSPASMSGLIAATSPPPQQAVSAVSRPMNVMSPPLVTTQTQASLQEQNQPTQTLTQSLQPQTQPNALRIFGKLEDMKVSDLKAELKRRNLTVSGSKPQLIERLKPFTDTASSTHQTSSDIPQSTTSQTSVSTATSTTIPVSHMGHIVVEAPGSVMSEESLSSFSMDTPVSPNNQQMSLMVEGSVTDDEVSLPNFSPVSQQLSPPPSHQTMSPERDVDMDLSSPQPPPSPRGGEDIIRDQQRKIEELQRELLRSQLQLQQIRSGGKDLINETPSVRISKSSSKLKNVKSQIVDDVLEILIKNGELPPSAAQDPATPTTPGRSLPQGLIFTASSPAPASPPVPPPPPPPPLPHSSFAITLPTAIRLASQTDQNSVQPFQMQLTGPEALDLILNSVQPTDGTSEGHQLSSDLQTAAGIDLKELGLDLETLDSMDFGQLDCSDLGVSVKLEPSDLLDVVTDMEVGVETSIKQDDELPLPDQLMNQQELMDIGEMPMDMDDADWLESLMPSDSSAGTSGVEIGSVTTPPHHSSFVLPSTGGINLIQCHTDLDTYDPLLSNSQDPFDLFNIEDSEFKMVGDLTSSLGWDKVDFAT
uniref:SAP domain-containing protein n=1 Tax=Timema bartmani TaxID=61472 RepID=A0A7R9HWP9_9NEOP|nr:unnamed protein product [Timema bartmani]